MAKPQAVENTMTGAVAQTITALKLGPEHAATALLARKYAELIDAADDLAAAMDQYGTRLFACLEALNPTAPKAGGGKGVPAAGPSKLTRLREARR